MLRSFGYAARVGLQTHTRQPGALALLDPWADMWEMWSAVAFLCAYLETAADAPFVSSVPSDLRMLLETFVLEKAVYELMYELNNRPEWVVVPLRGLLNVIRPRSARDDAPSD